MSYEESSQTSKWQLSSPDELDELRRRANRRARLFLSNESPNGGGVGGGDDGAAGGDGGPKNGPLEVYGFASTRNLKDDGGDDGDDDRAWTSSASRGSYPLLTPADEARLVSFYASKIPLLVGPSAQLPRCRRDAKVAGTATLLFRRFCLSNSVMIHDPKAIMVSAAFLATKVEDSMIDVRYLEQSTEKMQAHVPLQEILEAEVKLLKGCDFDLLMFHPYKTVLSYTEDLRTYLKSDRGKKLVAFVGDGDETMDGAAADDDAGARQVVGEDLRPMHDLARKIVDDVIVSDVPLLFGPGEVGLAALMVANDELQRTEMNSSEADKNPLDKQNPPPRVPRIDIARYVRSRFEDNANETNLKIDAAAIDAVTRRVVGLCDMLRGLQKGEYGCGKHGVDMEKLKDVHKKLKKCRAWGPPPKASSKGDGKKKKKKKRKLDEVAPSAEPAGEEGA